jgi:hypothetical protein
MPRLVKAELAQHRAWLSKWRGPADMAAYVTAVNDLMGSADFFRQGGVEFLRDAWLAAEIRTASAKFVSQVGSRARTVAGF